MANHAVDQRRADALLRIRQAIEPPAERLILPRLPLDEPVEPPADQQRNLRSGSQRVCRGLDGRLPGPDDDDPHAGQVAESVAVGRDRKSTRLNSSHLVISYAVFCLKKKKRFYW